MLSIIKHFKPYIFLIIISLILLFVQAMTDLSLPDYMSNIVNNGIQQGGIVNAVPEALRKTQMDKITLFMSEADMDLVFSNYMLIDKDNFDFDKYVSLYPAIKNQLVYVLKDISKAQTDILNPIIGKSLITVSTLEKINSDNKPIEFSGLNITSDSDVFELVKELPLSERIKINKHINQKISLMGNKMITQSATDLIKLEYEALDMNTEKIQSNYIFKTGLIMLIISLISAVCIICIGFLAAKITAGFARNLRKSIFEKVEYFSKSEFDKISTASLITRTTNDVTQIQMLVIMSIRMLFYAPIMGVGGIIKAVGKNPSMSWTIAVAVIALLTLLSVIFFTAFPKFRIIQSLTDKLNLVTSENLSGIMVVRAFNAQNFEEQRFDNANKELTDTNLFVNRVMAFMHPSMMLIMNGISLLIVWAGAQQIANTDMQVGDMMAFMQYSMQIIFSFLMISFMFIMIPRAYVSAQRIAEILNTESIIKDPENAQNIDNLKGEIEFKNVYFKYQDAEQDILQNISFTSQPGQTTAIIGSTGSGKTTLVNLIPRFYDVSDGQILIDGVDIRNISQYNLREMIGYVPQNSSLFSGTIESNLKFANENASENEINEAIQIAQAHQFVDQMPNKTASEVSQGGANLSGGQKQRLSIARSLMKNAKIYIFDDSFSALDFKTESNLRKELIAKTSSSTKIIVAQRISTIINADQIIVLDEGKIVGIGKHTELMKNCKIYQEIALSQLSKEELK